MMRERYSWRKAFCRSVTMVPVPRFGASRAQHLPAGRSKCARYLIYHEYTNAPSPRQCCSAVMPCLRPPWPRPRSCALGRRAREDDLAALDHVEPVGELGDVVHVRLGHQHARGPAAGSRRCRRRWTARSPATGPRSARRAAAASGRAPARARSTPSCARRRKAAGRRARVALAASGTPRRPAPRAPRPTARVWRVQVGSRMFSATRQVAEHLALLRRIAHAQLRDLRTAAARRWRVPSSAIAPETGLRMPMIVRNVVVLPAPLRPTRQTSSPAAHLERDAAQDAAVLDVDRRASCRRLSISAPPAACRPRSR